MKRDSIWLKILVWILIGGSILGVFSALFVAMM
jgi:hypothetical protein